MQASYASGCALGLPHRILGTQKGMETIQYGFACLMRTFLKATEARSAVVADQAGGAYAKEKGCHSDVRCTPSARHAHFAAHHFSLKCAGDFSCFLSFMSLFQCFLASLHAMHTFFPMTYIHVRDIYFFIYKTYKMVCIVCSTPKSPDKSGFKLHTMAKNGVQDSVHGVQGSVHGVQGSVHERRNARIGMACQAHAASLLYVHPHPTAARRAATLASSGCEMRKGARISL